MEEYPKTVYTIALTVAVKVIESGASHDKGHIRDIAADYLQHVGEGDIFDQDQLDLLDPNDDDTTERIVEVVKEMLFGDTDFETACWREYADRLLKQVAKLEDFARKAKPTPEAAGESANLRRQTMTKDIVEEMLAQAAKEISTGDKDDIIFAALNEDDVGDAAHRITDDAVRESDLLYDNLKPKIEALVEKRIADRGRKGQS